MKKRHILFIIFITSKNFTAYRNVSIPTGISQKKQLPPNIMKNIQGLRELEDFDKNEVAEMQNTQESKDEHEDTVSELPPRIQKENPTNDKNVILAKNPLELDGKIAPASKAQINTFGLSSAKKMHNEIEKLQQVGLDLEDNYASLEQRLQNTNDPMEIKALNAQLDEIEKKYAETEIKFKAAQQKQKEARDLYNNVYAEQMSQSKKSERKTNLAKEATTKNTINKNLKI